MDWACTHIINIKWQILPEKWHLLCTRISLFSISRFLTRPPSPQHFSASKRLSQFSAAFWGSFSRTITASASFVARSYGFTPCVATMSSRVDSVINLLPSKWLANLVMTEGSLESASHIFNRTGLNGSDMTSPRFACKLRDKLSSRLPETM